MPRTLKVAAIQMDATPAPLTERLSRAADLVTEAASAGAQLIALPELFNTGYEYHDRNYAAAEKIDGETVSWMKTLAAQHQIYLIGSLLLLDKNEVYNTALLVAPDGKTWRYDKLFPFAWERAYFKEGKGITVAETPLGKFGMMICWDSAHPDLWQQYAGRVDAMLIVSCPPKLSTGLSLHFPDGLKINSRELGGLWSKIPEGDEFFPDRDMDEQTAWLGVPTVHTVGGGTFRSKLPLAYLSLPTYLAARPDLWNRLSQASQVEIEAGFDKQTKIINADGTVLSRVTDDGDGFTLAEIELADKIPHPTKPQPKMRTPAFAYAIADTLRSVAFPMVYRQGVRKQWGGQMAPVEPATQRMIGGLALALLWRRFRKQRRKQRRRNKR